MAYTHYFVNNTISAATDAGGFGLSLDTPLASISYLLSLSLVQECCAWVHPDHVETISGDISYGRDANAPSLPIIISGTPMPQDTTTLSASTVWTHGSRSVTLTGASFGYGILGRYLTAPDGGTYWVAYVASSTEIYLNRPYLGSSTTAAGTLTAAIFSALFNTYDDSGDVTKLTDWESAATQRTIIDYAGAAYGITISYAYHNIWANFDHKDCTDGTGGLNIGANRMFQVHGCLFRSSYTTGSAIRANSAGSVGFKNCVFEGHSYHMNNTNTRILAEDCAFFDADAGALYLASSNMDAYNCLIGTDGPSGTQEILPFNGAVFRGYNCTTNASSTVVKFTAYYSGSQAWFDHWNGEIGAEKRYLGWATTTKVLANSGSSPQNRVGGQEYILKVDPNDCPIETNPSQTGDWSTNYRDVMILFEHVYELKTTGQVTIPYYVWAEEALTAGQFGLRWRIVNDYSDDATWEYTDGEVNDAISAKTGDSDWANHQDVVVTPAVVNSKIVVQGINRYFDSTYVYYISFPKRSDITIS